MTLSMEQSNSAVDETSAASPGSTRGGECRAWALLQGGETRVRERPQRVGGGNDEVRGTPARGGDGESRGGRAIVLSNGVIDSTIE